MPDCLLPWETPPADMGSVTELRVMARSAEIKALPAWVAELPRLIFLELPLRFLKSLPSSAVPETVEVLSVVGSGSATVPKKLALPSVVFLLSNTGTLKFSHDNFPSLDRLSLDLDRPQKMLDVVASYPALRALHLSSVHAADLFERIDDMALQYLGLVGGSLASLSDIGAVGGVVSLQLKNLSKLTDLSGVEDLGALEELSIGYCNSLTDVSQIAELPSLKRLSLFGMRSVGVSRILPALERKGLEKLSLAGAT